MLTEKDYCDYATCVALCELGMRVASRKVYKEKDAPLKSSSRGIIYTVRTASAHGYVIGIPLYEAQKWLREKGIVVDVTFSPFGYFASIYTNARQVESEHLKRAFKFQWDDKVYADSESFTYEEALLEGVREAIKLLKEEK